MDKSDLIRYINHNDELNEETLPALENLASQYPYFQTARLLLAKNRYHFNKAAFEKNLEKTAVFCADRTRFFYLINHEKYACFFPKTDTFLDTDRTQALLDSYFESFSEKQPELPKTELGIVSSDYLAYVSAMENEPEKPTVEETPNEFKHQDIIDNFLEKAAANEITFIPEKSDTNKTQESDNEENSNGFLTETLAQIYIKQKKYEQALTIIKRLSLNFPKKSIYFADQIRFLEFLILNEKNKKE